MWKELTEVQHVYSNVKIWYDIAKRRRNNRALNIKKNKAWSNHRGDVWIEEILERLKDANRNSNEANILKKDFHNIYEKWIVEAKSDREQHGRRMLSL